MPTLDEDKEVFAKSNGFNSLNGSDEIAVKSNPRKSCRESRDFGNAIAVSGNMEIGIKAREQE